MTAIAIILSILQYRRGVEDLEDQIRNNHDLPDEEKEYLTRKTKRICLYEMKSNWMLTAFTGTMEMLVWWIILYPNTLTSVFKT